MAVLRLEHSALKAVIQNYIQINKRIELFLNKKNNSSIFSERFSRSAPASLQSDRVFFFLFFSRKTLTHSQNHENSFISCSLPVFISVHRHLSLLTARIDTIKIEVLTILCVADNDSKQVVIGEWQ